MNFLDLPLKSRRAAFAKMDAADKAKEGASLGKKPRKASAKKAAAKKSAKSSGGKPSIKPSQQVSRQYQQSGKPTAKDVDALISNYRLMHGRDPSPAQIAKLRRKKR